MSKKPTIPSKLTINDFKKRSKNVNYLQLKKIITKKHFNHILFRHYIENEDKIVTQKVTKIIIKPSYYVGKFSIYCDIENVFQNNSFNSVDECIESIENTLLSMRNFSGGGETV